LAFKKTDFNSINNSHAYTYLSSNPDSKIVILHYDGTLQYCIVPFNAYVGIYNTLLRVFKQKVNKHGSFSFSSSKLFKKDISKTTLLNSMLTMCNADKLETHGNHIYGCLFDELRFKNLIEKNICNHSIVYINLNTIDIPFVKVSLINCHSIGIYSFVITSDSHYSNLEESATSIIHSLVLDSSLFIENDYSIFVNTAISPYTYDHFN